MTEPNEESNLPVPSDNQSAVEVAYMMRRRGMSLSDIAEELHTTPAQIFAALDRRLNREAQMLGDDDRKALLLLENDRLDYYLSKIWPSIEYGDLKAIDMALKITRERAKLNQMDAPSSTSTTQVLVVGGESKTYIDRLKDMLEDDEPEAIDG